MEKIRQKLIAPVMMASMLLLVVAGRVKYVTAQEKDGLWETPVNLSETGVASKPLVVAGPERVVHVFWQDALDGFTYTAGDGKEWSRPITVSLPFSEPAFATPNDPGFFGLYEPSLVVDGADQIHAFWRDGTGVGWYSRAPVAELTVPSSWTDPVQIAESLLALDVEIGEDGRLHVGYIRPRETEEFPAGVYYRQSQDGGDSWTEPVLIYQSRFLRSLSPAEANIQIGVESRDGVHLVWDDNRLDMVFTSRSPSSGETWSTPTRIDGREPDDAPDSAGAAAIQILITEEAVHLTWRAEHGTAGCAQYHQWSTNGGRVWQSKQIVLADVGGCPSSSQLVSGDQDFVFLLTNAGGKLFIQAWDGDQWSEAEVAQPLTRFVDPVTYREVDFDCHQAEVVDPDQLLVIGCGTGNGEDIWALRRPLGSLSDWFPPEVEPIWFPPAELLVSSAELLSPSLVTDRFGQLHAFWLETGKDGLSDIATKIYYTRWNGEQWSRVVPLIDLGLVQADRLSAVVGKDERFLVMWRDLVSNTYFFSQVDREQVLIPAEWSTPQEFPVLQTLISGPQVSVHPGGELVVIYAVPFNEARGIYLIQSSDEGMTWSLPALVFDGLAAGWTAVGEPRLGRTGNGDLHALWTQDALRPEPVAQSLYYSRSEDDGQNWSEPALLVEGEISWYQLAGVGERTVLVIWQEKSAGLTQLWSLESGDGGESWGRPFPISSAGITVGRPGLIGDGSNQLHLVQATSLGLDVLSLSLQEWVWQGDSWRIGDMLELNDNLVNVNSVAPGVFAGPEAAHFMVLYVAEMSQPTNIDNTNAILATGRLLSLPEVVPSPLPEAATPTPPPPPTVAPTLTPLPTPTTDFAIATRVGGNTPFGFIDTSSSTMRLAVGIVPAGLVVIVAAALYMFTRRSK